MRLHGNAALRWVVDAIGLGQHLVARVVVALVAATERVLEEVVRGMLQLCTAAAGGSHGRRPVRSLPPRESELPRCARGATETRRAQA